MKYTGVSDDESIAVFRRGKYIYGVGEGKTTVTVNDGKTEKVYEVTVLPAKDSWVHFDDDDDRAPWWLAPSEDDMKNNIYIGYSYNVFSGKTFDHTNVDSMHELFDWKTVYNSNNLYKDESHETECISISKKDFYEFEQAMGEITSGSIAVKFGSRSLYQKKMSGAKHSKRTNGRNSSGSDLEYIAAINCRYFLADDGGGYYKYLKPEVAKDLETLSFGEIIKKYGTHVAVGTTFGQSIEFAYFLDEDGMYNDAFFSMQSGGGSPETIRECMHEYLEEGYGDYKDLYSMYYGSLKSAADFQEMDYEFEVYNMKYRATGESEWTAGGDSYLQIISKAKGFSNPEVKAPDYPKIRYFVDGYIVEFELRYMHYFFEDPSYSCLISPKDELSLLPICDLLPADMGKRKAEFRKYLEEIRGGAHRDEIE
ncbi:MAG: Ig-like domain-containing protein [Lachnospiraceae bacterium]|nr:Ig-like domain-containing protein [Lachnospiraceae bacterium]